MRYHSLIANRQQLPSQLNTTATNNEGIMMAFEHDTYLFCSTVSS